MWNFVPAVIGAGLVIASVAGSTGPISEAGLAHFILRNMAISHRMALSASQEAGLSVGVIQSTLAEPFVNMADWKSEIVSGPSGKYLITWPGDFVEADERSASLQMAIADLGLPGSGLPVSSGQLLGRFSTVDADTGRVGSVQIPVPRQTIAEGSPVIASLLR